ncbi:hypothetical protein GS896_27785 [Rhodococcus hoagii]|nr:hypothetical protein [Prescottella equi]MBM4654055.1 hypothetical protein [Prescottella equi]MBM4719682.1 hypothetical protein [Prescottella equi]NKR23479.1 hypothetical protein [Prescottella equi]NKT55909.1 hypothetical protein [Prescottella equi]
MKKVVGVNVAVIVVSTMLTIASMSFANNMVELGFLAGVNGRKLFSIPFSGGIGVGVVNLIPIAGVLLTIGAAVHAVAGIPWGKSVDETEG